MSALHGFVNSSHYHFHIDTGLVTCCAASSTGAAAMLAVIARTAPALTQELAHSGSARPRFAAWSRRSRLQCRCTDLDERSSAMSAVLGAYEAAQYHKHVLSCKLV